jgi:hypothetical protein
MAHTSDMEKNTVKSDVQHDEQIVSSSPKRRLSVQDHLVYGNGGLKGIIGLPFVFGAALLASMGGFSFGYGRPLTSIMRQNGTC